MGGRRYYSVTSRKLREDDLSLLARVRRAYFEKNAPQRGRTSDETFGTDDVARYHMTRRGMKWELTAGGQVLQRAVPEADGYAVLTWDIAGDLREKADYNKRNQWLRSAFYRGNPKCPELLLKPDGEEIDSLQYDHSTGKYFHAKLFAYPMEKTSGARIWMDNEVGTPDIEADTSDGRFYYCPRGELEARKAAASRREKAEAEEVPDWDSAPDAGINFQFVRNEHVLDETTAPHPNLELESADGPLMLEVGGRKGQPESSGMEDCLIIDTNVPDEPAVIEEDVAPVPVVFQPVKQPEPKPRKADSADSQAELPVPSKRISVKDNECYFYFGPLENNMRQGQGRTQMQNGHTAYEGGFAADKREGFGTYYYKSGRLCYAGYWKQNRRTGLGVSFSVRDGSLFVGHWENNLPTGRGAAFADDGSLSYYGQWLEGHRDGFGTEYSGGKILYEGQWRNDCYDGKGCLHLTGGGTLSGIFRSGFAEGPCEERSAAGETVRTGVWQRGRFVSGVGYHSGKPAEIVVKRDDA